MRLLPLVVLLLAGCSHVLGYAGQHPGEIACKGKGSITMNGTVAAAGGFGGAGTNSATIQADCGDGFYFKQGLPDATPAK